MKLAFFGKQSAFDYNRIGGTESFVRRLAHKLVEDKDVRAVDYVLFQAPHTDEITLGPKIKLRYFSTYDEAVASLLGFYDDVVAMYIPPHERLKFAAFRRKHNQDLKFHVIYTGWPDSPLKRQLIFADQWICPFNGRVFVISPRQQVAARRWVRDPVLIWPPVPEDYFVRVEDKAIHSKPLVTYIGRTDPGKGIQDVMELFQRLKSNGSIVCQIYGYTWDPASASHRQFIEWVRSHDVHYVEASYAGYSPEVDMHIRDVLKETDILVLPYRKLSSTIDTPVLLLEGMAALCAIVSRPFGDIRQIYGDDEFLMSGPDELRHAQRIIEAAPARLVEERQRIHRQNSLLKFKTASIANIFLQAIN